jgi:hypothetical protein
MDLHSRTLTEQGPCPICANVGTDDRERLSDPLIYGRYVRKTTWVGRNARTSPARVHSRVTREEKDTDIRD